MIYRVANFTRCKKVKVHIFNPNYNPNLKI